MIRSLPFLILLTLVLNPLKGYSQFLEKAIEFLTIYPNKKAVAKDSTLYPAKAILTPVVSYAPETNLSFGVGVKGLFKLNGSGDETRTSNIPLTIQYSIENKYLFYSGFEIFSPEERYVLAGNVWIQSFPSLYFGIGQRTLDANEEEFEYSQILLEPIFYKNMFVPYLFFGGGFRYNEISQVKAHPGGLLEGDEQTGALGSTSSGIQLAVLYDSRDNLLNAKEGMYIELTHGFYGSYLGGSHQFQLTRFDLRYFTQPLEHKKSTLAFQCLMHFSHGDTPLHELGRLGGDEIMRGYFEGRFTDRHLLSMQVEWRQKLTPLWGFTVFAGYGGVANKVDQFNLETMNLSAGIGVRFLIDKHEDLNLRLDYGVGRRTNNYYFNIAEAF